MEDPIVCFGAFFFGLALGLVSKKDPPPQIITQITKKRKRKKRQSIMSPTVITIEGPKSYDIQKEEMEALSAIFLEDFIITRPLTDSSDASYKIFLRPNHSSPKDSFCSLYLSVTYSNRYPQVSPVISLINSVNIHSDSIKIINEQVIKLANEKAKVNQSMIYDICELIQAELANQNSLPITVETFKKVEELKTNPSTVLMDEIYGELKKRKRKDYEDPVQLNSVCNIKEIGKQLSLEYEPNNCHAISGFDYKRYFEEEVQIGKGGGGSVYKAKNKIDKCFYAIKKIGLRGRKQSYISYILKEVLLLSRLQHQHIVRYHNAWFEEDSDSEQDSSEESCSSEDLSDSEESEESSSSNDAETDNR